MLKIGYGMMHRNNRATIENHFFKIMHFLNPFLMEFEKKMECVVYFIFNVVAQTWT